jgi:hypothetical protein
MIIEPPLPRHVHDRQQARQAIEVEKKRQMIMAHGKL